MIGGLLLIGSRRRRSSRPRLGAATVNGACCDPSNLDPRRHSRGSLYVSGLQFPAMDTVDLVGIAAVITAISGPIAVVMVARLHTRVTHIDHAVNGKAPGAQSMVSQVAEIHTEIVDSTPPLT